MLLWFPVDTGINRESCGNHEQTRYCDPDSVRKRFMVPDTKPLFTYGKWEGIRIQGQPGDLPKQPKFVKTFASKDIDESDIPTSQ